MSEYVHQIAILSDYSNFVMPELTNTIKDEAGKKFILWKNDDIVNLIKNNFDADVLKAYYMLNGNAIKADLARYCILYVYGGWYFDLLMTIDGSLGPYNKAIYDMVVFRDITQGDKTTLPISNSVIWVKNPNNPAIKKAIDFSVKNILSKSYPATSHRIAGPHVFGKAIALQCIEDSNFKVLAGDLKFNDETGNGEFVTQSFNYRKSNHFGWFKLPDSEQCFPEEYQKGSFYNELFLKKKLYNDEY